MSSRSAPAVPAPLALLPNALTVARFGLVPVFVWLMATAEGGHDWGAAVCFGVAGVTDQVDGWLARRWRVESEFGKYADPLADRLMISAAVVMLAVAHRLPYAALAVVVARDLLLVVGARIVVPRGYEFSVSLLGKTATWALYAGVAAIICTRRGDAWPLWLFWAGVALAVAAAVLYGAAAFRALRRTE